MEAMIEWGQNLFTTEIYGGRSLADYFTLDTLVALVGNTVAAILILFVGFTLASFISRRIHRIGENHVSLDNTLFSFLGNIARYVVLAGDNLFVEYFNSTPGARNFAVFFQYRNILQFFLELRRGVLFRLELHIHIKCKLGMKARNPYFQASQN